MPGTTLTRTPRASRYCASSPPRPNTYGSPPLSLHHDERTGKVAGGEIGQLWSRAEHVRVAALEPAGMGEHRRQW